MYYVPLEKVFLLKKIEPLEETSVTGKVLMLSFETKQLWKRGSVADSLDRNYNGLLEPVNNRICPIHSVRSRIFFCNGLKMNQRLGKLYSKNEKLFYITL